ncbi:hypothetical protein FACS189494_01710 [Spirochaetia bacterium]|nr:hypothetical protein FACS189494_01710 [Spirochaetia bacterium]
MSGKQSALLEYFAKIIELSKEEGLSENFFRNAHEYLEAAGSILHLTHIQAAIFAHFLNHCDEQAITTENIAESIKCNKIQLIQYMDHFDELENRRLIRCNRGGHSRFREFGQSMPTYRVPNEVVSAVRKSIPYTIELQKNLSIVDFFCEMEKIFRERCEGELTYDAMAGEVKTLLDSNNHLLLSQRLKWYKLSDENLILLLRFCDLFINDDDNGLGIHNFRDLFEKADIRSIERGLKSGHHFLQESELIENANNYGLGDPEYFKLTDKAKNELLEEFDIKEKLGIRGKDFILAGSRPYKKLYYNDKEAEQIEELQALLMPDNFKSIQERLLEKGMHSGFACLFYGPPGTGKTETAYQIGRETGRDIMFVDISETKSKWFGESEKRIKAIFDRYKGAVKSGGQIPILLFNEADGVFSRRMEFSSEARSVDQTENAIQNIILQEVENLDGILIATTNLTHNLDKAFERRFLYKIEFEKPNKVSRALIWKSIIPELNDADTRTLAERYDFSGGQIENIARKRLVDYILKGCDPTSDKLDVFCKEEMLAKEGAKIGFSM